MAVNQGGRYGAADFVSGMARLASGVQFRGVWSFNMSLVNTRDRCSIYGSEGSLEFSFYGEMVTLNTNSGSEIFRFEALEYVQQPMIEATVAYFLGEGPNPCSAEDGLESMKILDRFGGK